MREVSVVGGVQEVRVWCVEVGVGESVCVCECVSATDRRVGGTWRRWRESVELLLRSQGSGGRGGFVVREGGGEVSIEFFLEVQYDLNF